MHVIKQLIYTLMHLSETNKADNTEERQVFKMLSN